VKLSKNSEKDLVLSPSCNGTQVVLHLNSGGPQWFGLVETFRSLLRLLFFFMTDQAGTECKSATKLTPATTPGPDEEIQHEWS